MEKSYRLKREIQTIEAMVIIYCHGQHHSQGALCESCQEVLNYALYRIDKCPFEENKPACQKCTIHCYRPPHKDKVKAIMAYAGPRMLKKHPYLSLMHILDKFRPTTLKKKSARKGIK